MSAGDDIARRARRVLEVCRAGKLQLATAESCTGGMIAAALTEIAGSSDVVERGFVTYSNEAKTELLGVPPEIIEENGAVSEPVARAMAEGAIDHSHADIAVSVTGIAGPGGGSAAKPVGTVHIASARRGGATLHEACRFRGDRAAVRAASAIVALDMVLRQAMNGRRMVALSRPAPRRAIGVDFSGSAAAGRAIWIAEAEIAGDMLRLASLLPAEQLPGGARGRDKALAALVEYLAAQKDAIVGLDFPFGLPAKFVTEKDWVGFVRAFPGRFPSVETLSALGGAPRSEPKRVTDTEAKTPFSAINRRVVHQTWAGIAHVLRPLIERDGARVMPQQAPRADAPILVEICPASTLKLEGLYLAYKGRTAAERSARKAIVDALVRRGAIARPAKDVEAAAIAGIQGDALDAVVAAIGAHRALYDPKLVAPLGPVEALEGIVLF
jgi:nicotinamide-nucleotide amidase